MKSVFQFIMFSGIILLSACTKDKTKLPPAESGYPDNIAAIVDSKCSIAGCHNTQSKSGAADLDMSTWDKAMEGAGSGAVIIPFYHKQSTVFLFSNTYDDLGVKLLPTMPYNLTPLTHDEV